jgi:hypothetical protein
VLKSGYWPNHKIIDGLKVPLMMQQAVNAFISLYELKATHRRLQKKCKQMIADCCMIKKHFEDFSVCKILQTLQHLKIGYPSISK